eukprot:TRINITY_DN866_c0_g3_i1.p1 TRINITY_DN866_c0_g3~~TRINITY_DN866_c0_g3_i1.p1  ORF type:complete len:125 (+),score=17.02 TRINITY_DN866_c0_g3_i1:453-827(+)
MTTSPGDDFEQGEQEEQEEMEPETTTYFFTVTIGKPGSNDVATFECTAENDAVDVATVTLQKDGQSVTQSCAELDESGFQSMNDLIASKGIGSEFARMIPLSRALWGDYNYEKWLGMFQAYLDK